MKLMRFALFFGAGVYLGLHAESTGHLGSVVAAITDVVEQLRHLR